MIPPRFGVLLGSKLVALVLLVTPAGRQQSLIDARAL
jgi:hypothetical protein